MDFLSPENQRGAEKHFGCLKTSVLFVGPRSYLVEKIFRDVDQFFLVH